MKGLLSKDLVIVRRELRTLVLLALCGVLMGLTTSPAFAVFYIAMVAGMMALGTIAYDENDHGYCFLMTLPVTRRDYVREKYLFCGGWTVLFAAVAVLLCLLVGMARGAGDSAGLTVQTGVLALSAVLLMDAIMIPMRLKFGSEKSRIVLYIAAAIVAIAGLLIRRFGLPVGAEHADVEGAILWAAPLTALIALAVSERISEGIMEGKEF